MNKKAYTPRAWGFGIEVHYRLRSDDFDTWPHFRKWLLSATGSINRQYGGFSCFWPNGVVTILGLDIGIGLFVRLGTEPLPTPTGA